MTVKETPYIGVTGITSLSEAVHIDKLFGDQGLGNPDNKYLGMAGYLVSLRSVTGELILNPRYPKIDCLPDMLKTTAAHSLNAIHYYSPEPQTLYNQLSLLFDYLSSTNSPTRLLQLNMAWPSPADMQRIKVKLPDIKLVLQLDPKILGKNYEQNRRRLLNYSGIANYVLLDPSGGKGKEIEPLKLVDDLHLIKECLPETTLIFAGGLTDTNITSKAKEIREETGEASFGVDAESGLRVPGQDSSRLDIEKVDGYVKGAYFSLTGRKNYL